MKFYIFGVMFAVVVTSAQSARQPKQVFGDISTLVSGVMENVNQVLQNILGSEANVISNLLSQNQVDGSQQSNALDRAQQASDALNYIRQDLLSSFGITDESRKGGLGGGLGGFNHNLAFGVLDGLALGKAKLLLQMTKNTGKLFTDTKHSVSKVLRATNKFKRKVQKSKSKFQRQLIKSKSKLVRTTKKALASYLKKLSVVAQVSLNDPEGARNVLEAENMLIEKTRESYNDILDTTARGVETIRKMNHNSHTKDHMVARLLKSASRKVRVMAKFTKILSKALLRAQKNKNRLVTVMLGVKRFDRLRKKMRNQLVQGIKQDHINLQDLPLNITNDSVSLDTNSTVPASEEGNATMSSSTPTPDDSEDDEDDDEDDDDYDSLEDLEDDEDDEEVEPLDNEQDDSVDEEIENLDAEIENDQEETDEETL